MIPTKENTSTLRKPVPKPLCGQQIPLATLFYLNSLWQSTLSRFHQTYIFSQRSKIHFSVHFVHLFLCLPIGHFLITFPPIPLYISCPSHFKVIVYTWFHCPSKAKWCVRSVKFLAIWHKKFYICFILSRAKLFIRSDSFRPFVIYILSSK